jgi:hypothetical protein
VVTDVRITGLEKISARHETSKRKPIESNNTHQKHSEKPKPKKKIVRRVKKHKKSPTENDTIDEEFNAIENSDSDEPQKPAPKKLKHTSNHSDEEKPDEEESDEEKPDEEESDDDSDAETSGGFRGGISYD